VPERPEIVPLILYVVGALLEPQEARKNETSTAGIIRIDFIFTLIPT
jgi:hypothetical protein